MAHFPVLSRTQQCRELAKTENPARNAPGFVR
jgi:hypothetical protein